MIVRTPRLLSLISFIALSSAAWAAAPAKRPVVVTPDQIFTVQDDNDQTITCANLDSGIVAGTLLTPTEFRPASYGVTQLNQKIKKAARQGKKVQVKKLKKKLKKEKAKVAGQNALCVADGGEDEEPVAPTPTPTPSGPPPSLTKLERPLTREDVRYLFEKAGFGMTANEENFVTIATQSGIDALVDAFMATQTEDSTLMPRVEDRLDGTLGSTTTQTPQGQRAALFDLWSHTKNPYAEKFAFFLLSVWTVSGDVVGDETYRYWFWNYYNRLRDSALGDTNLPSLGVAITRDPLMLRYLNNELNVKGNSNENYARELMELFTLGPTNLDGQPNYTETQLDGSGDIAIAAKMLTGWTIGSVNGVQNSRYLPSLHQNGPHTMFAGTDHQFTGENDADLVNGIFAHHPGVKQYYAREILKEYLTPDPPRELVDTLAAIIHANNYNLRPAMKELLKSEAFYSERFKNTVPKNSAEFTVEMIRYLDLADAVNYNSLQSQVSLSGIEVNNAPSVFWYNQNVWSSPSVLIERANTVHQILGDSTPQNARVPAWTAALALPTGVVSADAVIDYVAAKLGVNGITATQRANLLVYMNQIRNYNSTYSAQPYNNQGIAIQRQKGTGIYYILSAQPEFQLK